MQGRWAGAGGPGSTGRREGSPGPCASAAAAERGTAPTPPVHTIETSLEAPRRIISAGAVLGEPSGLGIEAQRSAPTCSEDSTGDRLPRCREPVPARIPTMRWPGPMALRRPAAGEGQQSPSAAGRKTLAQGVRRHQDGDIPQPPPCRSSASPGRRPGFRASPELMGGGDSNMSLRDTNDPNRGINGKASPVDSL
jgi:hypothetical protein